MKAFIVYRRVTDIDVSQHPWASSSYIDLQGFVDCVVLARDPKEVAEFLGLGEYYVEERYNKPSDRRWEFYKSCTIQLPREVFAPATEDNEWWGKLVKDGYDLLVFDRKPVHLYIKEGESKVIVQIDALPLVQQALVAS